MSSSWRFLLISASACALFSSPVGALTIVAQENPPFNFTEDGKVTGWSTELVTEMTQRAREPVKFELMAWEVAYGRAQADKDTCLLSAARLSDRENLFRWVGPLVVNKWGLYGKSDFNSPLKSMQDLAKYKVGSVLFDTRTAFLRRNGVTQILEADKEIRNPPKLMLPKEHAEHIDLWATGIYTAKKIAAFTKVSGIKMVYVFREEPLFLACSPRTSQDTIKKLNDALEAIRKDGVLGRIGKAYEKRFPY